MKKITSLILILLSLMFVGCGQSAVGEQAEKKILFTYAIQEGNEFRDLLAQSAAAYAKSVGAQLDIVYTGGSLELQVEQIQNAKEEGYDAVICIPDDADTARQLIVSADGLPFIFLNTAPDDTVLEENQVIYVGADEEEAGKLQAKYILGKLPQKEEINLILLKGYRAHCATIGRTESLKEVLEESGIKFNIVFEDYADFDTETAREMIKVFLKTGKSVDCIVANNDAMAVGAIKELEAQGIDTTQIVITGVDATEEGLVYLQNGQLNFTVHQSAQLQGEYAMKAAIQLADGKELKELGYSNEDQTKLYLPLEAVDAANIQAYLN